MTSAADHSAPNRPRSAPPDDRDGELALEWITNSIGMPTDKVCKFLRERADNFGPRERRLRHAYPLISDAAEDPENTSRPSSYQVR